MRRPAARLPRQGLIPPASWPARPPARRWGEGRAVRAARGSDLPAPVLAIIDAAPRYAEGTGIRLEVRGDDEVHAVARLVAAKLTR